MAAIYHSKPLKSPKPTLNYKSLKFSNLGFSHSLRNSEEFNIFVVVYHTPGPFSEFLSVFSDFHIIVLSTNRVIIVEDFNLHIDVEKDGLNSAFSFVLDSTGFSKMFFDSRFSSYPCSRYKIENGMEIDQLAIFTHRPIFFNIF